MRIQPKKILCAVDFSESTELVMQYGSALAREFGSKLYLCHIVPSAYLISGHMGPYAGYTALETDRVEQAVQQLEQLASKYELDSDIIVEIGNPAHEISRTAKDENVDMVIAATYGGSGFKRYLIGSVTSRLLKILQCPLLVLHPGAGGENHRVFEKIDLKRILVGCDFSEDSGLAFDYALSFAQEFQTKLYLAHVIRSRDYLNLSNSDYIKLQEGDTLGWNRSDFLNLQEKSANSVEEKRRKLIAKFERQLLNLVPEESRSWCSPTTIVLEGKPHEQLVRYGERENVDMIVLGVRGHGLLDDLLVGSTTDRVISTAQCPVLAVRQPDPEPQKASDDSDQVKSGQKVTTAGDIMKRNVITITPDAPISEAVKLFLEHHINGMPVLEDDRLVGILCQSDLIVQEKKMPMPVILSVFDSIIPLASSTHLDQEVDKMLATTVSQAMVKDPVTASPETPISQIASWMVEDHFHTIPVLDDGKLVGVIGKEDVLGMLI